VGADEERFLVMGAWNVVTRELLTREEFEQRGMSYSVLPQIFPALEMPMFELPPPPQGPPPSPPQGSPPPPTPPPASPPHVDHGDKELIGERLEASGAVHMVIDIPSSPNLIILSSDDEEELEPEEEDKPEVDGED